jgi:excisionase family DNA binding protein
MRVFEDRPGEKAEPLLISAKQASAMLGISQRHLYTLATTGELKPKRIGRRVMYRKVDLERFAADVE